MQKSTRSFKRQWSGTYKGFKWEIQEWYSYDPSQELPEYLKKHNLKNEAHWCSYIYIPLDCIVDPILAKKLWGKYEKWDFKPFKHINYYKIPIITKIDFHGGLTFFDRVDDNPNPRVIKIGCDYNHSFDEGHTYTINSVQRDIERSIDSLIEVLGEDNIKLRCNYNGNYYFKTEGRFTVQGFFVSNESVVEAATGKYPVKYEFVS